MRLVVADKGPIHYLVLIGYIEILARLFEKVILPDVVLAELSHEFAPVPVRCWVKSLHDWIEINNASAVVLSAGFTEVKLRLLLWPANFTQTSY